MPSYSILSQEPFAGETKYKVILKTDDGYEETQEYVGDETTLEAAATHLNDTWQAIKPVEIVGEIQPVEEAPEPVFVEVI